MSTRRMGLRDEVTATELAEMGFCEKRVQLAHIHGKRATPEQRKAIARGQVAHQRYLEEGLAATADRRCFVATFVFGPDARETQLLRAYRDSVLLRRRWGRALVAAYYQVAPTVCRMLACSPVAAAGVRVLLRMLIPCCRRAICRMDTS